MVMHLILAKHSDMGTMSANNFVHKLVSFQVALEPHDQSVLG